MFGKLVKCSTLLEINPVLPIRFGLRPFTKKAASTWGPLSCFTRLSCWQLSPLNCSHGLFKELFKAQRGKLSDI